ncbi:hypothetical protein BDP27DRAFT_1421012 [Rhodocollybia butyracea]|uniref:Uncharacterized protein n=1 Tax=Rhodocollybia butyracea TaxID=206335 RepID=A0A9P5U8W6_9AGAR|nr:hypothetical protein BDP27DRAFT_1421012 [Rhodocollybia butyracea]
MSQRTGLCTSTLPSSANNSRAHSCLSTWKHAVTVSWGLEGHLCCLPHADYDMIIDNSLAGPNKDAKKGRKLRQFILPSHYVEPDSSPLQSHTNQIFAAIVNPVYAWVFVDFVCLIRLHFTSLDCFGVWKIFLAQL